MYGPFHPFFGLPKARQICGPQSCGWGKYIDGPDKDAFVMLVGETNEFFAAGVHEGGEKHVETFDLRPSEKVFDCIGKRETNVL